MFLNALLLLAQISFGIWVFVGLVVATKKDYTEAATKSLIGGTRPAHMMAFGFGLGLCYAAVAWFLYGPLWSLFIGMSMFIQNARAILAACGDVIQMSRITIARLHEELEVVAVEKELNEL